MGEKHGDKDYWDNNNVFSYTGEGQYGDMQFTKGKKALRDHLINEKRVFLFRYIKKGYVTFESELEAIDYDYLDTQRKLFEKR